MRFDALKNALATVGVPLSHYMATKKPDKYIVWAEDNQTSAQWADGKMVNQSVQGTIDYFTKSEYDTNVDKIQEALNAAGVPFRLNSIQYEDETKYIHYEWTWKLGNDQI